MRNMIGPVLIAAIALLMWVGLLHVVVVESIRLYRARPRATRRRAVPHFPRMTALLRH